MALIPWWIRYPNVNDEIMNLDWLLRVSNENTEKISNFINLNTIKYADPILWDITSQYEANTITVDPQTGDAYISTKAVPYGVSLSNTDYWTKIYNYADEINGLEEQIAAANEKLSTTATKPYVAGELVWLNGKLYQVTANMIAGDSFVENSNCNKTTIESLLGNLMQLASGDDNLVAAINGLKSSIDSITGNIGSLENLSTEDKTSIVNAINEVYQMASQVGELSELTTEDKTSIVNAINEVARKLTVVSSNISTEFQSKRLFSYCDKHGAQFVAWTGSSYLLFNDTNSDGHITMTELNSSFQLLTVVELSVIAHPNGGWYHNGLIYICDVNSPHIYVVNYTTHDLVKTITTPYNPLAGCFYNGKGYFVAASNLYTLDEADNITLVGALNYDVSAGMVLQNIAIMNDILYFVWNRPNCVLRFDLNTLVQLRTMYLGDGDGYYPYGEIESLLLKDDAMYMISDLYYASGLQENFVVEFFETNINNDNFVPKDVTGYGPYLHMSLYVKSDSTANNPDGTASNAFNNLTEASMVYQYMYSKYYFMGLDITGTFDDAILIQNCSVEILGHNSTIKGLALYGCTGYAELLTLTDIGEIRECSMKCSAIICASGLSIIRSKINIQNSSVLNISLSEYSGFNNVINNIAGTYVQKNISHTGGLSFTTTAATIPFNKIVSDMLTYKQPTTFTIGVFHVVNGVFRFDNLQILCSEAHMNQIMSGTPQTYHISRIFEINNKNVAIEFELILSSSNVSVRVFGYNNLTDSTAVTIDTFYTGTLEVEF